MSNDERINDLSPEEKKVKEIFVGADVEISNINEKIKNLLPDKGPELLPSGMSSNRPLGTKMRNELQLKAESEKIKIAAKEKANKVVENSSPDLKEKMILKIDKWQNPAFQTIELDELQERLLKLRGMPDGPTSQEQPQPTVDKKENVKPHVPESEAYSMPVYYSPTPAFSKWQDNLREQREEPEKSLDIDIEKE